MNYNTSHGDGYELYPDRVEETEEEREDRYSLVSPETDLDDSDSDLAGECLDGEEVEN